MRGSTATDAAGLTCRVERRLPIIYRSRIRRRSNTDVPAPGAPPQPTPPPPHDSAAASLLIGLASVLVLCVALLLRLMLARVLLPHIDEPASLLAITMTAQKGVPLFPSDVVYLQGALLTYLDAPLGLALHGVELLLWARRLNIVISLGTVALSMLLVNRITRSWALALLAGVLVAADPMVMEWSVYIRPYGLLTTITMGVAYCFVVLVMDGPTARIARMPVLTWLIVLAYAGTFTHIGIWLLAPALAGVSFLVWGNDLWKHHRAVIRAGVIACFAPVLLTLINMLVGIGSSTNGKEGGANFVGDHLIDIHRLFRPNLSLDLWTGGFHGSQLVALYPFYLVGLSGLLAGSLLQAQNRQTRILRRGVFAILAMYWTPILLVTLFATADAQPRYLAHIIPLGSALVAIAAWSIVRLARAHKPLGPMSLQGLAAALIVFPSLVYVVQGTDWRLGYAGGDPDLMAAMTHVGRVHKPGQPVIVSLTPGAYFTMPNVIAEDDLYFLAGPDDQPRTSRYTKTTADGRVEDYWLGVDVITSTADLCDMLESNDGNAWMVVDSARLKASWAYAGPMADVIIGSSNVVETGANGAQVRRTVPSVTWSAKARKACGLDSSQDATTTAPEASARAREGLAHPTPSPTPDPSALVALPPPQQPATLDCSWSFNNQLTLVTYTDIPAAPGTVATPQASPAATATASASPAATAVASPGSAAALGDERTVSLYFRPGGAKVTPEPLTVTIDLLPRLADTELKPISRQVTITPSADIAQLQKESVDVTLPTGRTTSSYDLRVTISTEKGGRALPSTKLDQFGQQTSRQPAIVNQCQPVDSTNGRSP